jgi:hypothetical protein
MIHCICAGNCPKTAAMALELLINTANALAEYMDWLETTVINVRDWLASLRYGPNSQDGANCLSFEAVATKRQRRSLELKFGAETEELSHTPSRLLENQQADELFEILPVVPTNC